MRRTPVCLALLGALAVPTAAAAAPPAKISPNPVAVDAAGVAPVEAANTTAKALRGTATVTAGGTKLLSRPIRLPRRAVSVLALRFGADALAALQASGGRATLALKLRKAGSRKAIVARRALTFTLPAGQPAPAGDPAPAPAPSPAPGPAPSPTMPAPPAGTDRWVGRMGSEGAYDDLELTVSGDQFQLTKTPLVPVMCFQNGGSYRSALSLEPFDAGPWTLGTDSSVSKQNIASNQIVYAGMRPITYTVKGTAVAGSTLTGTLGMSFFDSQYDVFSNKILFVNCAGSQSFEAIPAT